MINQDFDVSDRQISEMKHCIGFSEKKVKNNKYLAWRNYFSTSNHDSSWDNLVIQGLASKRDFKLGRKERGEDPQIYSVTKNGFKFLEEVTGLKFIIG